MNSALYRGWVRHRRLLPRPHAFRYQLDMLYLDLDELDTVFCGRWFWSTRRPAPARFRRADHFGEPGRPLADCVREQVASETGFRPHGPIRLLTQPRCFGYGFNPISVYYCFDPDGARVDALLAEITNTPWGERRCYVLHCGRRESGRHHYRFRKSLHVSPFMPMDLEYHWHSNEPSSGLAIHLEVWRDDNRQFDATLALRRRPITGLSLASMLLQLPPASYKVIGAIYWQALRLWLKRTPVYAHDIDGKPAESGSP